MGRGAKQAARKKDSPSKVPAESAAEEAKPVDYSHLRPVPKNRGLLIVSALLLGLWFVALVTLVFVSRS